jgi:uncharacterized phage-associated protein
MISFNIHKTIQAAAYLIKRSGDGRNENRENYMRLLKLLYIAERTSLAERLAPICGDTPFAMERGPVMTKVLDLIKGSDPLASEWERFIERDGYEVKLVSDPGNLDLSRAEINILDKVWQRFREFDEWELVDWCHENLEEYQKNWSQRGEKKQVRIPVADVLAAVNRAGDEGALASAATEQAYFTKLFEGRICDAGETP